MTKPLPTPELLRKLLRYDDDTGKLFWRRHNSNDDALTAVTSGGYRHGRIAGTDCYAHRVIWAMKTGSWPTEQIDHINHDRADNRLENLREATNHENHRNKSMMCTNTSGTVGVYWVPSRGKWRARIKADGKLKHLGSFVLMSDAIAARKAAEIEHGFHPNHGT